MTDLTNRDVHEINSLMKKYSFLFPDMLNKNELPIYCVMFDVAINHINSKHSHRNDDIKSWSVLLIKILYDTNEPVDFNKLPNEQDIRELIDNFVTYYDNKYDKYINGLGIYSSEYSRDYAFLQQYIDETID